MGIGDGGDQTVRPLDRHIAVRGQIIRAVHVIRMQPAQLARGDQLVPFGVAADGADEGGGQPKAGQRHRDVQCNATGQARDAARHVRPLPHDRIATSDDVPQHRSDAKNVRCMCHAAGMAQPIWRAQVAAT